MIVKPLRHQLQRQTVAHAARLLHLGALVLKPDLDLRLVQLELACQRLPTLLSQVFVVVELALQTAELFVREGRTRALLVYARRPTALFLLHLARPRT